MIGFLKKYMKMNLLMILILLGTVGCRHKVNAPNLSFIGGNDEVVWKACYIGWAAIDNGNLWCTNDDDIIAYMKEASKNSPPYIRYGWI